MFELIICRSFDLEPCLKGLFWFKGKVVLTKRWSGHFYKIVIKETPLENQWSFRWSSVERSFDTVGGANGRFVNKSNVELYS